MKSRLPVVLFVLLCTVQVAFAQAPGADFDEYVNKAIKDWGVPGVAIAIVKDDARQSGCRKHREPFGIHAFPNRIPKPLHQ